MFVDIPDMGSYIWRQQEGSSSAAAPLITVVTVPVITIALLTPAHSRHLWVVGTGRSGDRPVMDKCREHSLRGHCILFPRCFDQTLS